MSGRQVHIHGADPDVFTEIPTQCSITGLTDQPVFVSVVIEDGSPTPEPCSWRNTIYLKSSSSDAMSEVTVHDSFRCKVETSRVDGTAEFSFRLVATPIKAMCDRQFRIAVYADRLTQTPLAMSRPFRNVAYKVALLSFRGDSDGSVPTGFYEYRPDLNIMTIKVSLESSVPEKHISDVKVMLNLSLVDQTGRPRPDLVANSSGNSSWWCIDSADAAVDSSDYTSLPVVLKCAIGSNLTEMVAVRVSVESVESGSISSLEIGARNTALFSAPIRHGAQSNKTEGTAEVQNENVSNNETYSDEASAQQSRAFLNVLPQVSSTEEPKAKLVTWVNLAMAALSTAKESPNVASLDKESLFTALAKYHLLGIEECLGILESDGSNAVADNTDVADISSVSTASALSSMKPEPLKSQASLPSNFK